MGVIVPVGFYNCTAVLTVTGSIKEMTVGFGVVDTEGGIDDPSVVAPKIATALLAGTGGPVFGPFAGANMYIGWRFERVQVDLQTVDGFITAIEDVGVSGTAGPAGSIAVINTAVLITKTTPLGGRKNKGRMYCPPTEPAESGISAAGQMSDTDRGNIQARWNNTMAYLEAEELPMCLFHSDGSAPTVVTGLTVQSTVATQRRRLR